MSTLAARATSPAIDWPESRRLTLTDRIAALGITVPDQKRAAYLMEVNRLGLTDGVSRWQMFTSLRWVLASRWATLEWAYFQKDGYEAYEAPRAPDSVEESVRKIQAHLSSVQIKVLAKDVDPWLEVVDDESGESLILHGWEYDVAGKVRMLI